MKQDQKTQSKAQLLNDQSLAKLLDVSVAWVRCQKSMRRTGKEHSLKVDPILIGKTRRYKLSDVEAWIEQQQPEKV